MKNVLAKLSDEFEFEQRLTLSPFAIAYWFDFTALGEDFLGYVRVDVGDDWSTNDASFIKYEGGYYCLACYDRISGKVGLMTPTFLKSIYVSTICFREIVDGKKEVRIVEDTQTDIYLEVFSV